MNCKQLFALKSKQVVFKKFSKGILIGTYGKHLCIPKKNSGVCIKVTTSLSLSVFKTLENIANSSRS